MASTAILVLGMHRSGTSALTAALHGLGASLGGELVAANHDNPGGYFENAAAVTAHETLLAELDRGWEDLRDMPEGWLHAPAAEQARDAIRALLAEQFGEASLWALKDPRMCRLLPLWQPLLAEAGVQAKYLFVLRHPDEVAASLGRRDGIGADHAYLLWLRYFLDAERDSRGAPRCQLTYESLLGDPVSSLARVGEALAIEWPQPPDGKLLSALLDPGQRHHRPMPATIEDGPRKAALDLHALACQGAWPDGDAQRALLQEWSRTLAPWLEGAGNALARARRDGLRALQRCQQAEAALEETKSLSVSRLADMQGLDARLQSTDAALEAAESLSLSRLEEMRALHARLQSTDAALEAAESLSLSRLEEMRALHLRLQSTDAALEAAESLSLSRLEEMQALDARLRSTDAALESATSLSLSRLEEMRALDARLRSTDAALESATALSLSRLEELQALDARLRSTELALQEASTLSLQRLGEVQALQAQLQAAEASLSEARTRVGQGEREIDALSQRVAEVEARLQRVLASRSWRLTRPLRWLSGWSGSGRAD